MTGYDIIGFWVSRMIFSGLAYTNKAPFDTVLIHGLVRDALGRKMSKSLGNGIDPLEVIDQYGADALRFTLATGNSPGNDMRFSDEKVKASRNFANKLWNAARFVLMNLDENEPAPHLPEALAPEDKWILSRYNTLIKEVTENLDKYELGMAVAKLYDFIWDVLCDWYIELCKIRLNAEDPALKAQARAVLVYVLSNTLKLLHPFMPFITEEIWQTLPHEGESIMVSPWPVYDAALCFDEAAEDMEQIMAAVRAIRNRRAEMNVPPSKKAHLLIVTQNGRIFAAAEEYFKRLASASGVTVRETASDSETAGSVSVVTQNAAIYIPMAELVDLDAERKRLTKELEGAEKVLSQIKAKLSNQGFLAKAPQKVIDEQKENLGKTEEKAALLRAQLQKLG